VRNGLLITGLARGGAAAQAGMRPAQISAQRGRYIFSGGDIITAINSEPVISRSDMLIYLEEHFRPSDQITLTVVRDGQFVEMPVTLGAR
jgi:2-alkenal reductase